MCPPHQTLTVTIYKILLGNWLTKKIAVMKIIPAASGKRDPSQADEDPDLLQGMPFDHLLS